MKKIAFLFMVVLLLTGCANSKSTAESEKVEDSVSSSEISTPINETPSDTDEESAQPPKSFTNFTVDSKKVSLPDINDFSPLLRHFPKTDKKIKSINIYYLSPSGGVGTMSENAEPFMKAMTLQAAQKYATDCDSYEFNENQQIIYIDLGSYKINFKYDEAGHPVTIIEESEGYRGSPEYKVCYKISWSGDTPTSISRKILKFESDYEDGPNDENLPFDTNFSSLYKNSDLAALLKSKSTEYKTIKNAIRISGTDDDGDEVVNWVEIKYY